MVAEGGGDGGGEVRGDDEGSFVMTEGEMFAELHRRKKMALPQKWYHQNLTIGFHFVIKN